jgi:hypothetical protein
LGVALAFALAGCTAATPSAQTSSAPNPVVTKPADLTASDINGVYEVTTTEEELVAGGVTDPALLAEYAGTYFWTFTDGLWVYEQTSDRPLANPNGDGRFAIDGTLYTHFWGEGEKDVTTATISVLADRSLVFTDIVDGDPELQLVSEVTFGLHPWVRVGD